MSHDKIFETKSTDMDTKGLQVLRSGQTFGWLRKKTQRFGVSRHCPRFFTVDFDARVLYYSHTEFGKKVSLPTPFCDILAVEPLAYRGSANLSDDDDMGGKLQRKSWKACLPRIAKDDKHGFTIFTKAKHIELRCSSASGSQKWIATIEAAVLLGKEGSYDELGSEQSTRTCSRESSRSLGNGSEQGSDGVIEQFEVEEGGDSPVADVPASNIVEPGRCLAVGTFGTDHPSSPSSPVVRLPSSHVTDEVPTLPLPRPMGAGSEQHGYETESPIQPCSEELPTEKIRCRRSVRFSGGYASMEEGERSSEEVQAVPSSLVLAPPVQEAQGDLQSLLIDAVLSSSSSTANNAWKRPQQPSIDKPPPQPNISPLSAFEEFEGKKLPTIKEESTPRAEEVDEVDETTRPSLRERFLARGVTIPHDIQIP